jgi:hypothetical protein
MFARDGISSREVEKMKCADLKAQRAGRRIQ